MKKHSKIRILLLFLTLSLIITSNILFAQQGGPRDPFFSLGEKIKLSQKTEDFSSLPYPIVVNGIIWTEKLPVAILNEDIVQEGQVWRDFKVDKIEKDKVILRRGESKFEIPMLSEEENEAKKD